MKIKLSMNELTKNYDKVFRAGYCDLQYIFKYFDPTFYNCGVYGWNCDIYIINGVAITTGYRNMRGDRIPNELLNKYNKKASRIFKKYTFGEYAKMQKALEKLRNNFINDLLNMEV